MPSQLLGAITDPAQANVLGAVKAGKQDAAQDLAGQILGNTFTGQLGSLAQLDPQAALNISKEFGIPLSSKGRMDSFIGTVQGANHLFKAFGPKAAGEFAIEQATQLESILGPGVADRTRKMGERLLAGDPEAGAELERFATSIQTQNLSSSQSAEENSFNSLIKDMSKEDQVKARRIKAGLDPRSVGSSAQTIAELGTAEEVGESEAIIEERKKFGSLTGSSRAKAIDKGFDKIGKINLGINTIDRAIAAIQGGAGTGALERYLPSFKAASVELDQIQKRLALDVISGVTLGAISAAELDLAKQVALPAGLDGPELIKHLQDRKAAQEKIRDYFQTQIDFLDQGGSVADFVRQQKGEKLKALAEDQSAEQVPSTGASRFQVEVLQ